MLPMKNAATSSPSSFLARLWLPRLLSSPFLAAAFTTGLVVWASIVAVSAFGARGAWRERVLFNSDFLFPAAFYHDLFVDGYGADGFQFSACTFVFPDVAAFFAVRALTGSTPAALVPWAGLLFVLLAGSAWMAGHAALPVGRARSWLPSALLALVAILLSDSSAHLFSNQTSEVFMPLSHNGALAAALVGFALVIGVMRSTTWMRMIALLLGLATVCGVLMLSDRWFGIWFSAPIAVSLVGCRILVPSPANDSSLISVRRSLFVLMAIAIGSVIGLSAIPLVVGISGDGMNQYLDAGFSLAKLGSRLQAFVVLLWSEVLLGNLLVIAGLLWQPVAFAVVVSLSCALPTPGNRIRRGIRHLGSRVFTTRCGRDSAGRASRFPGFGGFASARCSGGRPGETAGTGRRWFAVRCRRSRCR